MIEFTDIARLYIIVLVVLRNGAYYFLQYDKSGGYICNFVRKSVLLSEILTFGIINDSTVHKFFIFYKLIQLYVDVVLFVFNIIYSFKLKSSHFEGSIVLCLLLCIIIV